MSRKPAGPPNPFARAIASEIRAELGRQQKSFRDLARDIGKSHPYVTERLNEERSFDTNDVEAIADALGVALPDLIARGLAQRDVMLAADQGQAEAFDDEPGDGA